MNRFMILFLLIVASFQFIFSQDSQLQKFELGNIRIGYVFPNDNNLNSTFSYGVEPSYKLSKNINMGLKVEFIKFGTDLADASIEAFSSYVLTGDYYSTSNTKDQLFGGVGIGIFRTPVARSFLSSANPEINNNLGVLGRVGYKYGNLRLSFEYNIVFSEKAFDYYGIHLGFTLF